MAIGNRIQTLDGGTSYHAIAAIEQVLEARLANDHYGRAPYGAEIILPDGREFVYCYTDVITWLYGSFCCIDYTGGAASGQNPNAIVTPSNNSLYHRFGICTSTVAKAGGMWVQIYGRCSYARMDGNTDVTLGAHIKPKQSVQIAVEDHDGTATASAIGHYERCRAGSAGTAKWNHAWETVANYPWYDIEFTLALAAQNEQTYGDPCCQVFLTGGLATVA